jgi:hypothetical protein
MNSSFVRARLILFWKRPGNRTKLIIEWQSELGLSKVVRRCFALLDALMKESSTSLKKQN